MDVDTTNNSNKVELEATQIETINKEEDDEEVKPTNPEFSYLDRNEFTTEIYKIEVKNLGYFGIGEFKKLLKVRLNLDISKVKSPKGKEFAFVCFRSKKDQERGIEILNGYKWKGRVLQAFPAKASADPLMKRRHESQQKNAGGNDDENLDENSAAKKKRTSIEATCPLANLPYEMQVKQKHDEIKTLLDSYSSELGRINRSAKNKSKKFNYEGVLQAEQINGYRNKNEFTIGRNTAGEIIVGFRLGSYADGSLEVSEIDSVTHIPSAAKWAAKTFQEFVRASKFEPFNPEANAGHFRQLMVRYSFKTNELMLVPGIYSTNLTEDELIALKKSLIEFYENYQDDEFKCTSLYYQDLKRRAVGQVISPVEHLSGTTHITDTILDLNFRISPLAFFQINTKMAEVLYQKAIDYAAPKAYSTVLDVCCGTGSIGLAFAKHCQQVLGVEIVPEAIKDAEFNAQANNVKNCQFFTGNADDYIHSMVLQATYGNATDTPLDIIAVVDPPRNGLHNRSIAAIRAAKAIKRLVYISCNPTRAKRNWIDLARPESKQYHGDPFYATKAIAVDMFPHTNHIELVMLFERGNEEKIEDIKLKEELTKDEKVDASETKTIDEKVDTAASEKQPIDEKVDATVLEANPMDENSKVENVEEKSKNDVNKLDDKKNDV